jgi:hypothetical protein
VASEAQARPSRLEVVGDAAAGKPADDVSPAASGAQVSRRSTRLLALLLLLAALALVVQTRRVGELEGRVAELDSDLAVARQEIESYQGRLGQVRSLVDDLGTRLEELRGLLEPAPAPVPIDAPEEAL